MVRAAHRELTMERELAAMGRKPRILIYRLGSLGDTVVALPALRLVASAFPDAERWLLTNFSAHTKAAPMASVLEGTGLIHGYIEYPLGLRHVGRLLRLRRRVRRLRPEALVYLAAPRGRIKVWRDAFFFRACGIRRLIGVPFDEDQQRPRAREGGFYEYEGARLARCLQTLGDVNLDAPNAFGLELSDHEHQAAVHALGPLSPGGPLLVISIGAKADVKDWEDARISRPAHACPRISGARQRSNASRGCGWHAVRRGVQLAQSSRRMVSIWQGAPCPISSDLLPGLQARCVSRTWQGMHSINHR